MRATALYLPAAQAVHTRSAAKVGAALSVCPAAHRAVTLPHGSPLSAAENVVPVTHAAQVGSAVVVPAVMTPKPAGHEVWLPQDPPLATADWPLLHAVQVLLPAVLEKPFSHGLH